MKNIYKILTMIAAFVFLNACGDFPVDDRGLLITDNEECYMSYFELRGPDDRNVLISHEIADVDDSRATVTAVAAFGTNLKHVKPHCSIVLDGTLSPSMGQWIDFTQPREYTVTSGNRKVKKTYTITVKIQGE